MNITILPFVILIFSLYSIITRTWRFIRRETGQTVFKLLATTVVWGSISFIAFFPAFVRQISKDLGFGENLNTIIFFGFIVVFVILFRVLSILEKNERLLTEIIRQEALKEVTDTRNN